MSSASSDSKSNPPPAKLRPDGWDSQTRALNAISDPISSSVGANESTVALRPIEGISRTTSSTDTSSVTRRHNLQLNERDSIFATNYLPAQSPPRYNYTHDGKLSSAVEQKLGESNAGKVTGPEKSSNKPPTPNLTFLRSRGLESQKPKKPYPYTTEPHELLQDHPSSPVPAKKPTSMGLDGKQKEPSQRQQPRPGLFQRPSTSHEYNFKAVDEAERARYRSWRAGNTPSGSPAATAKRRSRSGDNTHIDKNIKAVLPRFDPPVVSSRSRKASQYLGLFKEKDNAAEQVRQDLITKERQKETSKRKETTQQHDSSSHLPSPSKAQVVDLVTEEPEPIDPGEQDQYGVYKALAHGGPQPEKVTPMKLPRSYTDFQVDGGSTAPLAIPKSIQSRSSRLVEEMRTRHDIELSSDTERLLSQSYTGKRFEKPRVQPVTRARTPTEEHYEYLRREGDQSISKLPTSDDDEESEREQISKALYYPHRQVVADTEQVYEHAPLPERTLSDVTDLDDAQSVPESDRADLQDTSQEVELSLDTNNETEFFHGDLPLELSNSPLDDDSYASSQDLTYSGSEYETQDEASRSAYYGSSSDEAGETPRASPKHRAVRKHQRFSISTPVGAVELKPFDHQVGGHSTVYRFSRRAVCKQLNNRENTFYETVERWHPELLTFMPRYIGVLNVTYRKTLKRRKTTAATSPHGLENDSALASFPQLENGGPETQPELEPAAQPRIVSHSQQITPVPQVVLENNRHIIPHDMFRVPSRVATPRPQSSDPSLLSQMHRRNLSESGPSQADPSLSTQSSPLRPAVKQHASWGATTVNTKLKEQILREVFSAPPIHRHQRRGRHHRVLSHRHLDVDAGGLSGSAPPADIEISERSGKHHSYTESENLRRSLLRGEAQRNGLVRASSSGVGILSPPQSPIISSRSHDACTDRASDLTHSTEAHYRRRRHSGGGLVRKPFDINSSARSNLEFHEEEEGYGGDGEDDVFAMDDDAPNSATSEGFLSSQLTADASSLTSPIKSLPEVPPISFNPIQSSDNISEADQDSFEPTNPREAVADKDERAQLFILLEDLTAGMVKPCVLDLKMGTRQYGVEADSKKMRSQRRKCQSTTSQELGVRVCGMQFYNMKTQSVIFRDKYYGRDLKAGSEFQEAIKGFFFDGYGHSAALKHIPTILENITNLEAMIRKLPGYRFYASSLLMLYDCCANESTISPNSGSNARHSQDMRKKGEIKMKIVDFANCVTAEEPPPGDAACPPHNPDGIDRGYLRGLRSLRLYFQRILKDLSKADWIERDTSEWMASEQDGVAGAAARSYEITAFSSDDEGNVSI